MSELAGKRIAIDVSIYLYKFTGDGALLENMYLMLSIFRHYRITPVFVFDGKPPDEKRELLDQRKEDKSVAKLEYNKLKAQLETDKTLDNDEKQDISNAMDILKKQFIYIQKDQILQVKELMRAFGATYFDAPGEADEICAFLAVKKKVWACLSEDMDLFVYGCPRVLRYFSLIKHNAIIYHTHQIFEELGIEEKEFRQICVLSGTDYNIHSSKNTDLYNTLKLFKKYHKRSIRETCDFYEWVVENTDYIEDYEIIQQIYSLFDVKENRNLIESNFENVKILNGPYNKYEIKKIMEKEGFLF
jgi:5'-3' exonuclease